MTETAMVAPIVHLRLDDRERGRPARYACGIDALPAGEQWVGWENVATQQRTTCTGCLPHVEPFGTPLSQLAGRPDGTRDGNAAYDRFVAIGESWGYP